eukprot:826038-Amphidinium_carterae.3
MALMNLRTLKNSSALEQLEAFTPRDRRKLLPEDKVIGSRCVVFWKRTETGELVYRARWVPKDFADHKSLALFAPTTSTSTSRISRNCRGKEHALVTHAMSYIPVLLRKMLIGTPEELMSLPDD